MATSSKLTYLNTTKQLLKTEINKINNVLTDNSTFRSYPQELFKGYLDILNNGTDTLWNNLEKVSASGETPILENVETAPIKMVLNGNTSQETTSGKNILPIQDGVADLNGVTLTIENGILTLNGTTTASGSFKLTNGIDTQNGGIPNANWLQEEAIENLNGKVLSFQNISGVAPTSSWAVRLFDNTTTYTRQYTYSQLSGDKLFDTDIRLGVMTIYLNANLTFDNFKIAIQIENGTSSTDFEKYTGGIPSPNPDYPQEVKVVKGENVVSVQGKNLLNVPSTFSVTTSANITASLNAGTYTISLEDYETNVEVGSSFLFQFLKDNTLVTDAYLTMSYKKTTKAIPSEVDKIRIYASSSYNNSNGKTTTFKNLMIEQNSTATPYVPYSKTDYPINLGDIELCKINTYKDYFHKDSGKWYVHKEIGKVVLDGTQTISSYNTSSTNTTRVSYHNLVTNMVGVVTLLCNMLPQKNNWNNDTEGISYNAQNRDIWFRISKSTIGTTQTETNSFLATNNMIIYYVLATPTEEEITNSTLIEQLEAISKAKSVKDKTYITQTNDELPFILDVEAIKEYEVN